MIGFIKKHGSEIAFAFVAIICAFFFGHVVSLATLYFSGVTGEAEKRADLYTEELSAIIEDKCNDLKREAEFYAVKLTNAGTEEEAQQALKDIYFTGCRESAMFLSVCRVVGEEIISWDGSKLTEYPELDEIVSPEKTALSRAFQYDNHVMAVAAAARADSPYADAVLVLYDRDVIAVLHTLSGADERPGGVTASEFTLLCKYDGRILERVENTKTFSVGNEPIREGILDSLLTAAEDRKTAEDTLRDGGKCSFSFRDGTEEYVLTIHAFGKTYGNLSLLSVYKVSGIYGEGFALMEGLRASLLGLGLVMVVLVGCLLCVRVRARRRFFRLEMEDATLHCATPKRFESDATEILKRHKTTNFALVSMKLNNFGYVAERFGDAASEELAKFAANVVRQTLMIEETFAYAGEGTFLLLLHFRERQAFTGRLNGMYLRLSSFSGIDEGNYKISASFAVYEILWEAREPMRNMLDKLKIVRESSSVQIGFFSACFYEDILEENHLRKAEIEGRMENALENSEFHLFYQPKYNLRSKTLDGCEILIRWYDPKLGSYRVPGIFLPVFEEDGFITKMDHFVFYRACENIAERIAKGGICYPVSVNVSRVTAIQPDFTEYYIRIKEKFGIKDDFLTLEFTESFAYENYDYLSDIVATLHKNGFLCSIDDFGTGYSSYNILKSIDMDEIKLDKFFLSEGISKERDETLLKSVIDMIKKLGMKVTQEGVETGDDLRRMEELGCDVIQGYCFAKPMKYMDYCEFIDRNFKKPYR